MKKIGKFTRDRTGPWEQLALDMTAEQLGTIWQLTGGEDYPEGQDETAVQRMHAWAKKHGLKCRCSILNRPQGGTVEVQFTSPEEKP